METKERRLKIRCLRFCGIAMTILLSALPCLAVVVPAGETWEINYSILDFLEVYGTANLEPGAHVEWGIYAYDGSTVNIRGGTLGSGFAITVFGGPPSSIVTVYGTGFADSSGSILSNEWTPAGGSDTLTGTYENDAPISLLFNSDTPIILVDIGGGPGPEPITIDIKPGSTPNAINLGSMGVVPVAILSTPDLDATTAINPENVFLAGAGVAVRGKGNKYLASEEDVNGDGLLDLVVKVETENLDPGTFQDGYAILQVIVDNTVIYEGADEITIVPPE
jgi:hypothetical protein